MFDYRWLFILQAAPYSSPLAIAGLDALMAAAAFGQSATALFTGAGTAMLNTDTTHPTGQRNIAKTISSLPLYDIEHIYLDDRSVPGSCKEIPNLNIHRLDQAGIALLISNTPNVIIF